VLIGFCQRSRLLALPLTAGKHLMEIPVAFGKAVKIRRIELSISQEDLANRAGLSRSFLSGVELGNRQASVSTVWRLAEALECQPSDLWLKAEALIVGEG